MQVEAHQQPQWEGRGSPSMARGAQIKLSTYLAPHMPVTSFIACISALAGLDHDLGLPHKCRIWSGRKWATLLAIVRCDDAV